MNKMIFLSSMNDFMVAVIFENSVSNSVLPLERNLFLQPLIGCDYVYHDCIELKSPCLRFYKHSMHKGCSNKRCKLCGGWRLKKEMMRARMKR